MAHYQVVLMSDGTGETANHILKAAMLQFGEDIFITRHGNIRDKHQIDELLERVVEEAVLVVYTFVSKELREHARQAAADHNSDSVDLLGPLMERLTNLFHRVPVAEPGLFHQVDEDYFVRVEAIEFAIQHDNNSNLKDLDTADIVLLGVSRTSKTPLGIYLAQEGWRVANVGIRQGTMLPKKLFQIDQHKVVGLSIDPERLVEIRKARVDRLADKDSDYIDMDRIGEELEYAHSIYRGSEWPVIDVTGKSLEELSQEVLDSLFGKGRKL